MDRHRTDSCHRISNQGKKWKNLSLKVILSFTKGIKKSLNQTLKAQTGPLKKKNTFSSFIINWVTSGRSFLEKWMEGNFWWNVDLTTVLKIIFIHDWEKDWRKWIRMLNKVSENVSKRSSSTFYSKSLKPLKMDSKTITSVRLILQSAVLVFSV